jgi:hypothetical protein
MNWIKLNKGELDLFSLGRLMNFIDKDDGYLQQFVIVTGDGHAHPSFGWIDKVQPLLRKHIADMAEHNVLCAHVEKLDKRVRQDDLPLALQSVHRNGKLFGWELSIFEHIEVLMEEILSLSADDTLSADDYRSSLRFFYKNLSLVLGFAKSIGKVDFILNWMRAFDMPVIQDLTPDQLKMRLIAFNNQLMGLRTDADVHRAIAHGIWAKMKQYKNHSHLISIGNAHLIHNNICKFIDVTNTGVVVGVVDIYTGNADMVF